MDEYGPASYGDAFADVYDDWYADVSDVEATVAALVRVADGGPVLELGIGSGRVALPLAARGVPVWGIDASTAMLDRLRAKPGGDAIRVALGDMAEVDLSSVPGAPERFAVVLLAFNTFFNLVDEDSQRRCLSRCAALLGPGGTLVIEASVPEPAPPGTTITLRSIEAGHVLFTVTRTGGTEGDEDGVVRGEHLQIDAGGARSRRWVIRLVSPGAIDEMASAAGLRLVERWATWDSDPYGDDAPAHISLYVAR